MNHQFTNFMLLINSLLLMYFSGTDLISDYRQMHAAPPLAATDKVPAPRTKYTDDIESFVTYDVTPKDRAAALMGAQRAVTWMENHGALDYYPPSEGNSP